MPRPGQIKKREVDEDPYYKSKVIARLINRVMQSGKKDVARKLIYRTLDLVKEKTNEEPLAIFNKALENIKPQMEVRSRRVGGAAYQVPTPVRGERKEALAIRWLIQSAKAKSSKEFHTFAEKLGAGIMDAFNNTGAAIKKREDTHRMAEANKAFSHFRW